MADCAQGTEQWGEALSTYVDAALAVHVTLRSVQGMARVREAGQETALGRRIGELATSQAWPQACALHATYARLRRVLEDCDATFEQALDRIGFDRRDYGHLAPSAVRPLLEARSQDELLEVVVGRVM